MRYTYRCSKCGDFDRDFRFTEAPDSLVCDCGLPAERVITCGAGILYKGQGWTRSGHGSGFVSDDPMEKPDFDPLGDVAYV